MHDGLTGENVISTLGSLHRVNDRLLDEAKQIWESRLSQYPGPRVAILIGNVDSSALLYLQGGLTGSTNAGGIPIFAQQLIQINASGNFFLTLNNSTLVNATVTEIYLCTT